MTLKYGHHAQNHCTAMVRLPQLRSFEGTRQHQHLLRPPIFSGLLDGSPWPLGRPAPPTMSQGPLDGVLASFAAPLPPPDLPLPLRLADSFNEAARRSSGVRVSDRSRWPQPGASLVGSGRSSGSGMSAVSMPAGYAPASQNLRMAAAGTPVNGARRVLLEAGVWFGHVRPIRPDPNP